MKSRNPVNKRLGWAVLFSGIGILVVFRNLASVPWQVEFSAVNWLYIGLGFIVLIVVWSSKAYRLSLIALGMGQKLPFTKLLQIYLSTCFLSHVTPFNAGGTPLQIYLLSQQGLSAGKAAAITVFDLGIHSLVFLILVPIAILADFGLLTKLDALKNQIRISPGFILILVGGLVFLAVLVRFINWRELKWLRKLGVYLTRKGWFKHLNREISLFKEGWVLLLREHPFYMVGAVLATIFYWLGYLLLAPLILRAIGKAALFWSLMGWQLIFNFAQILIPTPGGSGGSELVLAYLFKRLTGPERIGMFVLFWRMYTYFSTLLLGSYYFFKLTRPKSGENS